jgi:hypothetical protein
VGFKCPSIVKWTLEMLRDALEAPMPSSTAVVVDAVDRMIGDALQDMSQIELRINIVEFGRTEQAVNGRRAFAAGIANKWLKC